MLVVSAGINSIHSWPSQSNTYDLREYYIFVI
jgi:hypothetical protein